MSEQESGWWEFSSPVRAARVGRWSPLFAGLVQLMIDGPGGEDHLCGQVSARILESRPVMFSYRIARSGVLVRCEDLDGRIHFIAGRDTVWSRGPTGQLAIRPRRPRDNPAIDNFEFGCARPTQNRWDGDDFTVPTGPELATTFLGRAAWSVELAPPSHKPFPMQTVIDANTGLILREESEAFGTFHEWTGLDTDVDLPDALFAFKPDIDTLAEPLPR